MLTAVVVPSERPLRLCVSRELSGQGVLRTRVVRHTFASSSMHR